MQPITLEAYLPLTEESCSTLLSDMNFYLEDFIEEQMIIKGKQGIAKEYFSKQKALGELYQQLAYQKNILNNGQEKTFLDELLALGLPNSLDELYARGLFLNRISYFIDSDNIEANILNTPLKENSFHIKHEQLNQSKSCSGHTIKYLLKKQITQDTLVDLFNTFIIKPKNPLSHYIQHIEKNIHDQVKLSTILNEFWQEFSFSNLREQIAPFALLSLIVNKNEYKAAQIGNIIFTFYEIIYEYHDSVDVDSMRCLLLDLGTKVFDLETIDPNKKENFNYFSEFPQYVPNDKILINALRFFRDEQFFKHLLPYQQTTVLYKDISLKVKDKEEAPQVRKNKI